MDRRGSTRITSRCLASLSLVLMLSLALACSGPESGDDADPTPTPTATPTATPLPPTPTPTPTVEPTATPDASPTLSPTAAAASPTFNASPTAIEDLSSRLPMLTDLPGDGAGYIIAEEGTRTAQDLANAYSDPAAHLQRLNTWGFKRHVFRAFVRDDEAGGLPSTILTTINEYGSPEQASDAVVWLKRLATTQGASEADVPTLGDETVAVTQPTTGGSPTASLYVRDGASVYVYFAQGGDPLPAVIDIASTVLAR